MTTITSPKFKLHRLGVLFLVGLIGVAGVFSFTVRAEGAVDTDPWVQAGWAGQELPNLTLILRSMTSTDPRIDSEIVPGLAAIAGVDNVFIDVLPAGPPAIHLHLDDQNRLGSVIDFVDSTNLAMAGDGEIIVGGQLAADALTESSITRSTVIALFPVAVIIAFVVAALYGKMAGFATGFSLLSAPLFGGLIASGVAGAFDGSIGTTVLPGAITAFLVGCVLSFRLLNWFRQPRPGDAADNALAAVRSQAPDLVMTLAVLLLVALVTGLFSDGGSLALSILLGATFGALATLATLPLALANTEPLGDSSTFRSVPIRVLDGRHMPVAVVITAGAILLVLGLVAANSTAGSELTDSVGFGDSDAEQIAQQLPDFGGDPAGAIRATAPEGGEEAFQEWVATASDIPGIDWVYTADGLWSGGEIVSAPAEAAAAIDGRTAIISTTTSARSATSQNTVRALNAIPVPEGVSLDGVPVIAEEVGRASTATLWLVVGTLAIGSGLVMLLLIRDIGLAVVAIALRLLTTAALLGAYYLVVADATAVELQLAVLIVGVGTLFFEIGLIRMIAEEQEPTPGFVSTALRQGGGPAIVALLVVAFGCIGLLASSVPFVSRFGVALAALILLDVLLGAWIMRPVVLGEQAARLSMPGVPGRSVMGRRGPTTEEPINPEWRRIVSSLLREEFRFQTEPTSADLGAVFVENTPLFNELAQHNLRLRENGLRIAGEGPTVVSVKAVNDGDPVTVAITVDHPSRQLLSGDGRLLGVRAAERRDGMLWLSQDPSGRYRIAEAVDMGSGVPLPAEPEVSESAAAKS